MGMKRMLWVRDISRVDSEHAGQLGVEADGSRGLKHENTQFLPWGLDGLWRHERVGNSIWKL